MAKHPITARQIGLHHGELNLRGGQVSRTPDEVLLISRVHAKLLITSKEMSKGRREQPERAAGEKSRASRRFRRPPR